ncbi:hypothetical protein M758_3G010000 [Ceratodon purpureus]|nr:hypothetical protein M758_3G010000 [Ceratodon purpureus]
MLPLSQSTSWTEWLSNQAMIKIIYFCVLTGFVKERLLQRYFSSEVRDSSESTLEGLDVLTTVRHVSTPHYHRCVIASIKFRAYLEYLGATISKS